MLMSTLAVAQEPTNLAIIKQDLLRYHDSGEYTKDIAAIDEEALRYLKMRIAHSTPGGKKPAIVLDIDETSLSNYASMVRLNFGGTRDDIRRDEDKGKDPAIEPTLKLYRYARDAHVAIFFITGRYSFEREATIRNLRQAGYTQWNGLFFKPEKYRYQPVAEYKTAVRKQLTELGYDIILNVGDQYSDLKGGYADERFKLPNPYYLIP